MAPCPCDSGRDVDDCCAPIIAGTPAPTAEALLRSRYTAFTRGDIDYLADTLGPELLADFDQVEARNTAADADWQGIEIRSIEGGSVDDDAGSIEFVARFRLRGQHRVHHELAEFGRIDGRWLCTGGQTDPKAPPRQVVKVGRNDPCPCGSDRKYKKCCGA